METNRKKLLTGTIQIATKKLENFESRFLVRLKFLTGLTQSILTKSKLIQPLNYLFSVLAESAQCEHSALTHAAHCPGSTAAFERWGTRLVASSGRLAPARRVTSRSPVQDRREGEVKSVFGRRRTVFNYGDGW